MNVLLAATVVVIDRWLIHAAAKYSLKVPALFQTEDDFLDGSV